MWDPKDDGPDGDDFTPPRYERDATGEEIARLLDDHKVTICAVSTSPLVKGKDGESETTIMPPVESTPIVGTVQSVVIGTKDTHVIVLVLPDGDTTVRVFRKGEPQGRVDLDPEPGVTPVADPACTCKGCTQRREAMKVQAKKDDLYAVWQITGGDAGGGYDDA
jgi:hypothetical protein